MFSLRCFGSGEVVKPACSLVRFRGDEAGVVVVAAVPREQAQRLAGVQVQA